MLLSVCLSVCCCLSALVCAAVCFSMCTAVCLPWCVCRCLPWCAGSISSNGIHVLTYILMGQEPMPPLRNTFAGVSALHLLPRLSKTLLLCGPHSLKQGDHLLGGEFGFVCLLQEYPEFAVHSSLHGNAFTEQLMSFSPHLLHPCHNTGGIIMVPLTSLQLECTFHVVDVLSLD